MPQSRTALITGGSRGIGRAIALGLAHEGLDIILTYVSDEKAAEQTADSIRALDLRVRVVRTNVAYKDQIDELFQVVTEEFGSLDIFVSNAVSANMRPLEKLQDRHWEYMLNANLSAFFYGSQRARPLMEERGGTIIGLSSIGTRICVPGYGALGVAKAGMETLARYLALEWAPKKINVNVVCGGPIDTDALSAFSGTGVDVAELKERMAARTPAGRLGLPSDLIPVILFLCREEASWIRGQTIVVDGGYTFMDPVADGTKAPVD